MTARQSKVVAHLVALSLTAVLSIEPIQLHEVGVRQNLKALGIGKQLNTATTLTSERLEPFGISGPEESIDGNEVLGCKMGLPGRPNYNRLVPVEAQHIQITAQGVALGRSVVP